MQIRYRFHPCNKLPVLIRHASPKGVEVIAVEHPHEVHVICPPISGGLDCEIRSKSWFAQDDEADFKEALRLIVEAWNRRPVDDSASCDLVACRLCGNVPDIWSSIDDEPSAPTYGTEVFTVACAHLRMGNPLVKTSWVLNRPSREVAIAEWNENYGK